MPSFFSNAAKELVLLKSVEPLLLPLTEDAPCGQALRYDPVFTEIRLAREEDNPDLPMGHWERPLKKADWALIEKKCVDMLVQKTKDMQIAAWLLEAWVRQDQLGGLCSGLVLLTELQQRFWMDVHPLIETDGDCDARVAPLEWLNDVLPLWLKLHVSLVSFTERKPARINLADWDQMTAMELAIVVDESVPPQISDAGLDQPLTRHMVIAHAHQLQIEWIQTQLKLCEQCLSQLAKLEQLLRDKLGTQAPSLSKIQQTIEQLLKVFRQLTPPQKSIFAKSVALDPVKPNSKDVTALSKPVEPSELVEQTKQIAFPINSNRWQSRDDAYATLEALADYLGQIEPHSPTPYLIRRAVNWGRMPLPELMAEIVREEGDLNRMLNILGLQKP